MKKIVQFFLVFSAASLFGQAVSEYSFIKITTTDFADGKYGLVDLLTAKLKQKNYTVFSADLYTFNPCDILTAEIKDTSNMFRNRLEINFKDCNNKLISAVEGKSLVKDFEPGMRDALQIAAAKIPVANPVTRNFTAETSPGVVAEPKTPETVQPKTAEKVPAPKIEKPAQKIEKVEITIPDRAEVFSNGSLSLNRIIISPDQFILVNPGSSVPYATFRTSTKPEVFHVELRNGTSTLGYMENGNIVLDLPASNGDFKKEIFERK